MPQILNIAKCPVKKKCYPLPTFNGAKCCVSKNWYILNGSSKKAQLQIFNIAKCRINKNYYLLPTFNNAKCHVSKSWHILNGTLLPILNISKCPVKKKCYPLPIFNDAKCRVSKSWHNLYGKSWEKLSFFQSILSQFAHFRILSNQTFVGVLKLLPPHLFSLVLATLRAIKCDHNYDWNTLCFYLKLLKFKRWALSVSWVGNGHELLIVMITQRGWKWHQHLCCSFIHSPPKIVFFSNVPFPPAAHYENKRFSANSYWDRVLFWENKEADKTGQIMQKKLWRVRRQAEDKHHLIFLL